MRPDQTLVVDPDESTLRVAHAAGAQTLLRRVTPGHLRETWVPRLRRGDFLLNLSVDVSSTALIQLCRDRGVLYMDTCIEPWAGGYIDTRLPPAGRTNYALREAALRMRRRGSPTALLTHGANPGLVSHFVKQALLDIARDTGVDVRPPASREDWALLAMKLDIRTIHIAERDTQVGTARKAPGEFVNTWSVEAFVDEGCQPAELGWGSHERHFPAEGVRHEDGSMASIYLLRPGAGTKVRTWTPLAGPIHGFLITHAESISIADHLTIGDPDHPVYRPTVHYAYQPCDDALLSLHELAALNWQVQTGHRVMKEEIISGMDELGVLLMGHARGAYWYGSRLTIEQARALAPHNSATSLQVTAAVMAGVVWAMKNPAQDVVEPDDLPFDEMLAVIRPYLGDVVGVYSDWNPLQGRAWLFDEDIDRADPWQFKNFRVT
jgi:homospermidine synthase